MSDEAPKEIQPVLSQDDVDEILQRLDARWTYMGGQGDMDWQQLTDDVQALVQSVAILRHMASVTKIRGPKWKNHVLVRLDSRQGFKGNRLNWRYRPRCRCKWVGSWWQCEKENPTPRDLASGGQDQARLEFDAHVVEEERKLLTAG